MDRLLSDSVKHFRNKVNNSHIYAVIVLQCFIAAINLATYKTGDGSYHPLVAMSMFCMHVVVTIIRRRDIATSI